MINGLATYSQFLWISLWLTLLKIAKSLLFNSTTLNG